MKLRLLKTHDNGASRLSLNLVGQVLTQGISFFLAPLFSRLLLPEEYGLAAIFITSVGITSVFVGVQSHGSINNARIELPPEQHKGYISSCISISFVSFIIMTVITFLFCKPLGSLLGLPEWLVCLIPFSAFGLYCVNFTGEMLIAYKKSTAQVALSVCYTFTTTVLSILLIICLPTDKYLGKIGGGLIVNVAMGIALSAIILYSGKVFYKRAYWKYCLPIVLPLVLHVLSGQILAQSDRIMLNYYMGSGVAGIYSFCYSAAVPIMAVWAAINSTWNPQYYELAKENDSDKIIAYSNNINWMYTCITVGFVLVCPEIVKVIGTSNYYDGIKVIPLVAVSYYIIFLYSFPANHQFYHKKTRKIALNSSIGAIVNLLLNWLLIPRWGMMGAAVATVAAYALIGVLHDTVARFVVKDYYYKYSFYLKGLAVVAAFTAITYLLMPFWIARWLLATLAGILLIIKVLKEYIPSQKGK